MRTRKRLQVRLKKNRNHGTIILVFTNVGKTSASQGTNARSHRNNYIMDISMSMMEEFVSK